MKQDIKKTLQDKLETFLETATITQRVDLWHRCKHLGCMYPRHMCHPSDEELLLAVNTAQKSAHYMVDVINHVLGIPK